MVDLLAPPQATVAHRGWGKWFAASTALIALATVAWGAGSPSALSLAKFSGPPAASSSSPAPAPQEEEGEEAESGMAPSVKAASGEARPGAQVVRRTSSKLDYLLYLPAEYMGDDEAASWPLVVFLHGAGESAPPHDATKLLAEGASGCPPMLEGGGAMGGRFVLASPQTGEGWGSPSVHRRVLEMIDDVAGEFRVDKRRVYLTGVSMGGAGTWSLYAAHPARFAAAAPVCGYSGRGSDMEGLRGKPVWAFHGGNDVIVPASASDSAVEEAKAAGALVKYTRYPESPAPVGWPDYTGHASWIQAYADPELWGWMLQHSL